MYEKLYVSEVVEISEGNGLIVEVTKGKGTNTVSIWMMYVNEEGQWSHTGTKSGPKNLKIPLNRKVIRFIASEMDKADKIAESIEKAGLKVEKKAVKTLEPGVLPDLTDPAILAAFTVALQALQSPVKKAPVKKAPVKK